MSIITLTFLDDLPRVCSYWHQLSIHFCALWSHIDLAEWGLHRDYLYSRARLWIKRAGDSPLDIHICGDLSYQPQATQYLSDFLAPLMKQVFSLKVDGDSLSLLFLQPIFICWFINGAPGTLRRLTISDSAKVSLSSRGLTFTSIVPNDRSQATLARVEEFFRPITVLALFGAFLPFDSHAYHDLVELQLVAFGRECTVTQSQLMATLSSSPRLRTIVLGVNIVDPIHNSAQFSPVPLENLEELEIIESSLRHHELLLAMLAPGPKPLTMSIELDTYSLLGTFGVEAEAFFRRSTVVALRIKGSGRRQWFPLALGLLPDLHTLLLQSQTYNQPYLPEGGTDTTTTPLVCPQLRNLVLLSCTFRTEAFIDFIAARPIQMLGLRD